MNLAKIATELHDQMKTVANQDRMRVVIRHKAKGFTAQATLDRTPSIDHRFELFPGEVVEVTAAEIGTLSTQDEVEQIWPDLPVHACLNTSIPKIRVPSVWNAGFRGRGIKIAVLDTGIDTSHPDFSDRLAATASFVGGSVKDDNGHGTHVAGTIAGNGAKSKGKYVGVVPEATLYIAKVLKADGGGAMSGVMAGIEWAILEQKVQIINLSLSGTTSCDGTDALSVLCDEAVLQGGVIMCVAAGNAGPGLRTIGSPGCARQVITIGAMDDHERIATFSSRGPTADGRTKPDLVFPGVDVIAPQAKGTTIGTTVEPGYATIDGTSMATPHAAGVVALMLQANPSLTAQQVKKKMIAGAIDIGGSPNERGAGRGDAYQAYLEALRKEPDTPPGNGGKEPRTPTPSKPPGCLARLLGRG